MKSLARKIAPGILLRLYKELRRRSVQRQNQGMTLEQVFTDIYTKNRWGGNAGEFYSGLGTRDEFIVSPYVSMIAARAVAEGFMGSKFVDLGCGDFCVGRQLLPLCSEYIGVDVVGPLVRRNQETYGNSSVRFVRLDIVSDELPTADVCFLRQVLQHLSNDQIAAVLSKLHKYRWIFITEHQPSDCAAIIPNKDKIHGGDIRLYDNSGVYLTSPPFSLAPDEIEKVLEVRGSAMGEGYDPGVIRTFLYKPRPA